jgi:hypothetical protein
MRRFWLVSGALAAAAFVYNVDAFTGQWKFKRMCKEEGGPRFFGVVEKDVGWEVGLNDERDYEIPFNFGHVAFVRFRKAQTDSLFDVHIKSRSSAPSVGYDIGPADLRRQVRYRLSVEQGKVPGDERMSRRRFSIAEADTGKTVATHTSFSYQWTLPERVLLHASTSTTCHAGQAIEDFAASIYQVRGNQ